MKIYTKTGDKGTTSLVYGERVSKFDLRVDAYGTCDEANSFIGLALSKLANDDWNGKSEFLAYMHKVQTVLFHVGAELATPKGKEVKWTVKDEYIEEMEQLIDSWDATLPPLKNFILPGGHEAAAVLHVARTVIRRAERKAVELGEDANPKVLSYLNRLSDFLFIAARKVNHELGGEELTLHEGVNH